MMNRRSSAVGCRAASSIIIHCTIRRTRGLGSGREEKKYARTLLNMAAAKTARWVDMPPASWNSLDAGFQLKFPGPDGKMKISRWSVLYQLIADYDFYQAAREIYHERRWRLEFPRQPPLRGAARRGFTQNGRSREIKFPSVPLLDKLIGVMAQLASIVAS